MRIPRPPCPQVQIWPVILLSNKQLWWRYGAEQARRCAPGFALVGWLFPALVTLACTPFAKQRITHLGLMFAPGGPERGILMVAYVLLMAVGLWALMGTRHSILPYIFRSEGTVHGQLEERLLLSSTRREAVLAVRKAVNRGLGQTTAVLESAGLLWWKGGGGGGRRRPVIGRPVRWQGLVGRCM